MKLKKMAVLFVGLSIPIMSFTGCVNKEKGAQSASNGNDSFTYWCSMPAAIVSHCETMADVTMYQELEKRTGVKINFIHPTTGQEVEQFNLLIASREFPDFIEWDWGNYQGGPEKALSDNVIIKLNEYMDTCTPNLSKVLKENEEYDKQTKTDNGAYYGFPTIQDEKYNGFAGLLIRQDWLDELGLPMPETLADWETTLKAFKEKKGAMAPFTGRSSGLFNMFSIQSTFNNAFNVGKGLYIENDVVKFGPLETGYKEWLTMMSKWYEEGLLDADYATNSASIIDAKMTNGSAGACFGYVGGTIGKYMNAMAGKDSGYNLVAAPFPKKSSNEKISMMNSFYAITNPFLAITTGCKNPEAAAKWADYLYSEEGKILKNFGVEGETYTMVDGEPQYTDKILNDEKGLDIATTMSMNFRASYPSPGFANLEGYLMQYYQLPQQLEALETLTITPAITTIKSMPLLTPTSEEYERISIIQTEVGTYIDETIQMFVQGTKSMDEYNAFISNLKKMKIDEYIEIYQRTYDRWRNR